MRPASANPTYGPRISPNLGRTNMTGRRLPPDKHYSEPEIIPPGREIEDDFAPREIFEERSRHRIYVTRIGPLSFLPFALLTGLISIVVLLFLFGFLLILIPVAGIVLAAIIIGNFLRGPFRWPR